VNKFRVAFELSDQQLHDLLDSAYMGSKYWGDLFLNAPVGCKGFKDIVVTDYEADEQKEYRIPKADLYKGFQNLAKLATDQKRRAFGEVIGRIIAEEYDQNDADLWLQALVFGEIVYG
jgi:hypothetical protein